MMIRFKLVKIGSIVLRITQSPHPGIDYRVGDVEKDVGDQLQSLLDENSSCFAHNPKNPRECTESVHVIKTKDDRPIKDKQRNIPLKWMPEINQLVDQMLKMV